MSVAPEVLVIGEPLVELSAAGPLDCAESFTLSFSGDALNAAAASAAAGARTALLTRVGEDEVSRRLVRYMRSLSVDAEYVTGGSEPTGAYLVGADPAGTRDFVYLRAGSAATRLRPADLQAVPLSAIRVLLVSGITMAISASAADTVRTAARAVAKAGGKVIYDPNFRRRLTTASRARDALASVAPWCHLVLPSCPTDSQALLDTADPRETARRTLELGAANVCVTQGEHGVLFSDGHEMITVPAFPAPAIVDATGAGDAFAGTLAAAVAQGPLNEASVARAAEAAARALGGQGGTGHLGAAEYRAERRGG